MSEYIITGKQLERLGVPDMFTEQEIVRCRDCNEYNPEFYNHITCELLGRYVEPDGFCAWGERRNK